MATNKAQLIEQLEKVFVQRGYDGATLAHLARATGLSKASLYHHFPGGKPEMVATLVRRAIAELHRLGFAHLNNSASDGAALTQLVNGFVEYTQQGESDCILAVISHHGTADEGLGDLQLQVAAQFQDWHADVARTYCSQGAKPKRADRDAHELIAQMYGALMNARIHQQPELFVKAMRRLAKSLH